MEKCEVVFCVLTYKNGTDLIDFLKSLRENCRFTYKTIVVNSYYDEESKEKISKTAEEYGCDFLNVPNKGYGAGNNRGIEFAIANYDFEYLIVSNPDIIVKEIDLNVCRNAPEKECILAPKIICRRNKNQNPAIIKNSPFGNKLTYKGYKKDKKLLIYAGIAWYHFIRIFMKAFRRKPLKIFQCHGSFVIFSKSVLEKLFPVYDENIFMFCEEMDLGYKARKLGVNSYYFPRLSVYHKEDGSIKVSDLNVYNAMRKSNIYCTEKWNAYKQ